MRPSPRSDSSAPSAPAARRRAAGALVALVVVNAVVLWFYMGASAFLGWNASLLDEKNLRSCIYPATPGQTGLAPDPDTARFVGSGTVEFTARGEGNEAVRVRCELAPATEDSNVGDLLRVEWAEVVR